MLYIYIFKIYVHIKQSFFFKLRQRVCGFIQYSRKAENFKSIWFIPTTTCISEDSLNAWYEFDFYFICLIRKKEILKKLKKHTHALYELTHTHTHTHTHTYIYIYIYIYMFVCVCVCLWLSLSFYLVWSLCLMAYQLSWVMLCRSPPCRRPVMVLYN